MAKLYKKDHVNFERVDKKIKEIISHPEYYKNLSYGMSDFKRVHVGHFVMTFRIDYNAEFVWFDDFDHHDNIFKR
ncbi:MAG: addiction module toxin RelE [Candidatus Nanoarchaeia archaeon]|nr:addiction module toxin RelE [Candidatus Nanoarchaeia archaeon]MDD5239148.1 addiction module toxin RelE [Candidatus Nanoarchaeia archaeon]